MAAAAKTPYIKSEKPGGLAVLGIIYIIFGTLMVVTVAMILIFSTMMGGYLSMINNLMGNTMTVFGGIIAIGVGTLAAIEFIISWGLFSSKSIGRITVMVLSIVDFIIHCVTLFVGNVFAIPHIILDLITFFYMWKPNIIAYYNQRNIELA